MVTIQTDQFVNVSVTLESAPLSPASFGRALILGPNAPFAETFRLYSGSTGLADMVADGFATTDQEYIDASDLLAQSARSGRRVQDFLVGRRTAAVQQVDTLTAAYDAAGTYTVTISMLGAPNVVVGPVAANTDDPTTATDIANAINGSAAGSRVTAAATAGGALTVTSDQAGIPFTIAVAVSGGAATFVRAATTPNNGIAEDLAAILAAGAEWYLSLPVSRDRRELVEAAQWTESAAPVKLLLGQFSDAADLTGAYDAASPYADFSSELKALGYNRTAAVYHALDGEGLAAAIAGYALPFDPGTLTWAAKQLSSVTADSLTPAQVAVLTGTTSAPTSGKNVLIYNVLNASTSRTMRGMLASGRYIDQQRTLDMLQNSLEVATLNVLLSRPKVAFNDAGISEIVNALRSDLLSYQQGADPVLDPETAIVINAPAASAVSSADRTARRLDNLTATARLAGAIHFVNFAISVSV